MKKEFVLLVLASFMCNSISAQRYFEANDIRYRVLTEADEASTFGTVSVAKPEVGEYEDDVVIPNVVKESNDQYADAYKVIGIDEKAFAESKYLESVELPASIETMGKEVFRNSSIKKIIIPVGNLTEISESAFEETMLRSVEIPTTIKKIGERSFANCFELAEVEIGDGLVELGKESFKCCYKLEKIALPNSLRKIGDWSFGFCYRINELTLGSNIKSIGERSFHLCMGLRHIDLPEGLKEIGEGAFAYSGLIEIKIPESMREIKETVFASSMLQHVSLHQKIRSIESNAFYGLNLRETVEIPAEAKVSEHAFEKTIFDFGTVQDERKKYLNSRQKELLKETVSNKDIEITRGDGGEIGQNFLIIVNGKAYCPITIPSNDDEFGALYMCGDNYSIVVGIAYDDVPQMKSVDLKGDIIIPDLIEIEDGFWKGKYVVSNMNVMDNREVGYKSRVKSVRYPIVREFCLGEVLVPVNDTELSYKSNIKATSRENEVGESYKEEIRKTFQDISNFLDNPDNLKKLNTASTYTQEFLQLYNDAICVLYSTSKLGFFLNELNVTSSFSRKYINSLRKKLMNNITNPPRKKVENNTKRVESEDVPKTKEITGESKEYKKLLQEMFQEPRAFLSNDANLESFPSSASYIKEFMRLYNNSINELDKKGILSLFQEEYEKKNSYTRTFIDELRRKQFINAQKLQ